MTGTAYRRPESVLVVVYARPVGATPSTNLLPQEGGRKESRSAPEHEAYPDAEQGEREDARVLLLERKDRPGFWQSVTGSLELGESPAQAARRELAEETGIEGEPEDLEETRRFKIFPEFRNRFPPDVSHNLEHAFAFDAGDTVPITLNREEHARYRWLPWRDAAALTESWTNREAIESLFAAGEGRR